MALNTVSDVMDFLNGQIKLTTEILEADTLTKGERFELEIIKDTLWCVFEAVSLSRKGADNEVVK